MEEARENCGFCITSTLHDAYSFGKAIQHRGREATGIAAIGDDRIDVLKWEGTIDRLDITDLHKIFPGYNYHTYMIHVRYATRGRKDKILEDAHPHVIGGEIKNMGDHMLILDCEMAAVHNGQVESKYFQELDESLLKTDCDTEALLHFYKIKGEIDLLRQIPGSYTMAITDKKKKGVIVLRDRTGIKPGVLGWKDGRYGVASEDIAFRKNGGEFVEDLQPGAMYHLSPDSKQPKPIKIVEPSLAYCFFEWNYIAHVDSIINGLSVRRLREALGESVAEEFNLKADFVTYIPRCPETAARSYARKLGIEFLPVFYKMRGERSFMGSTLDDRTASIKQNLFMIYGVEEKLKGKVIVVIDDSFVRGNVLKRLVELFEGVEAKKVYVISYTPPIGIIGEDNIPRGCSCGVDMPFDDNFLIRCGNRNRTLEEISMQYNRKIQPLYLSSGGMFKAYEKLGMPRENLDTYCIGGDFLF